MRHKKSIARIYEVTAYERTVRRSDGDPIDRVSEGVSAAKYAFETLPKRSTCGFVAPGLTPSTFYPEPALPHHTELATLQGAVYTACLHLLIDLRDSRL